MDFLNLLCTFVSKFNNIIGIMQAKDEDFTSLGLMSYYNGLTRKEKVKLKSFIALKFGLSYYTVDGKFCGRSRFSTAELLALQPIISEELWKQ